MKAKKYSIIGILLMIVVATMSIGFAGCYSDRGEQGDYYYAVSSDTEYTLSLTKGKITMVMPNETVSGSYEYKGGDKLTIKFKGQSSIEADYDSKTLIFSYNGSQCHFFKSIDYTVTFVADGKTVATQTVKNGKSATKPNDPTKDSTADKEYKFVAWYTGTDYKSTYTFAPVTDNETVYGRFLETKKGIEEFTVTFAGEMDSSIASMTTIGQTIPEDILPVPTKSGKTFAGWFVSAYEDASKLTYKYTGETLAEDTTLYAVWKQDGYPIIESVTSSVIKWSASGTGNQYKVEIKKGDGTSVYSQTLSATQLSYDFNSQDEGDYVITVTLNNNTATAYYKNKALAKVRGFKVEGYVLMYNAVEGAEHYYITVECGDELHMGTNVHADVDNSTNTSYDFSNCTPMADGTIKFTVKATAEGKMSSTVTYTADRNLSAVSGFNYDKEYLTWNAVENATSYTVTVTAGGTIKQYTVTENKVNIADLTGEITVKVTPVADKYKSPNAETYTFDKASIAAPTATISGDTISWTAVSGATSYKIKVGDKVIDVSGTSYTFTSADFTNGETEYKVSVMSVAQHDGNNSAYSTEMTVGYKVFVGEPVYNNHKVTWSNVVGASRYEVEFDTLTYRVSGGVVSYTLDSFVSADTYDIVVKAYDANNNKFAESTVTVVAYKVTYSSAGSSVPASYYADTDVITLPTSVRAGYDFQGWYDRSGSNGSQYIDGSVYTLGKNATFYAHWLGKQYTITLDLDGTGSLSTYTYPVRYGDKYTLPTPDMTGVVETTSFSGWYDEANLGGNQYADQNGECIKAWEDTKNITLFAGWAEGLTFVLTYNPVTNIQRDAYAVKAGAQIGSFTQITIPATYNGKPIVAINAGAFNTDDCAKLVTVNIPNTIINIDFGSVDDNGNEIGSAFPSKMGTSSKASNIKAINSYDVTTDKWNASNYSMQAYKDACNFDSINGSVVYTNEYTDNVELVYIPAKASGAYTIPKGVEVIPAGKLKSKTALTSLTVPYTVKTIEANAFKSCTGLTSIVFEATPDGVSAEELTISDTAFASCSKVANITLTSRISADTNIVTILKSFSALANVSINGTSTEFTVAPVTSGSKTNAIYSADGKKILYIPKKMTDTAVVIPATVTTIGEEAFKSITGLTTLTISSNVENIEASAFYGCTGLTKVTFQEEVSNNVPLVIGTQAFYNCTNENLIVGLASSTTEHSLTIPARVTEIGTKAFYGCKFAVVTIGYKTGAESEYFINDVRTTMALHDYAFGSTTSITATEITITPNVTTMYANALYWSALASVNLQAEEGQTYNYEGNLCGTGTYGPTTVNISAEVPALELNLLFGSKIDVVNIDDGNGNYLVEKKTVPLEEGSVITKEVYVIYNSDKTTLLMLSSNYDEYVMPDSVTKIGGRVFRGKSIKSVVINANLEEIGDYAFYQCTDLESVTFAEPSVGVDPVPLTIGDYAFYGCTNSEFKEIDFPSRTVSIGAHAFWNCKFEELVIPEGVETIGDYAFQTNSNLKTVTLPSTLKNFGGYKYNMSYTDLTAIKYVYVFAACNNLESVTVNDGGDNFSTVNGVLYQKIDGEEKILIFVPKLLTGNVVIPNTVTYMRYQAFYQQNGVTSISFSGNLTGELKIGDQAFYSNTTIQTVTLAEGVTGIGEAAFRGMSALTSVTIPSTVTSIGTRAFAECKRLTSVTFADGGANELLLGVITTTSASSVSNSIFYNDSALTALTLPNRPVTIKQYAFAGAGAIQTIVFKGDVTAIEDSAFRNCSSLETVRFEGATTFTRVGEYAFADTALENITLPESVTEIGKYAFQSSALKVISLPSSLEGIGNYAFQNTKIKEITIPASVTYLGWNGKETTNKHYSYVFKNCKNLTKIVFEEGSQLTRIDQYFVQGCTSLKTVVLVEGIEEIYDYAFRSCALESINIPSTVQRIGDYAFDSATNLNMLTFDTDANGKTSLMEIGNYAFARTGFSVFTFPETAYGITLGNRLFENASKLTRVVLSSSVTDLSSALNGCSTVQEVEIPASNKNLSSESTSGCSVIYNYNLTEIKYFVGIWQDEVYTVPDNVTSIGKAAFNGQYKIKKIVISETVKEIKDEAFQNCYALEKIEFAGTSNLTYLGTDLIKYDINLKSLTLPDGLRVIGQHYLNDAGTTIVTGSSAFEYSYLEEVYIPSSVWIIGASTFYACKNLKTVNGMQGVTYIFANAFNYCSSLDTIDTSKVQVMYASAFANTTSLRSLDLNSLTTFEGGSAFSGSGITSLSLPKVKYLYASAFYKAASVESIYLNPDLQGTKDSKGVVTANIPSSCFNSCTSLSSVNIPDAITSIGSSAFSNCSSLVSIDLNNVESIENTAFNKCSSLVTVRMPNVTAIGKWGTSKTTKSNVFSGCVSLREIDLSNVTSIYNYAFDGCTALESIDISNIDKGKLGTYVFENCTSLSSVTLGTKIVELPTYTFYNCTALTSITLPSNITNVGNFCFAGTGLTSIDLTKVTTLGTNLFKNCTSLTSVTFGKKPTTLPSSIFYGCTALSSITLPATMTSIGASAFVGCTALTSIDLSKVKTLGGSALKDCTSLASVTLGSELGTISSSTFEGCTSLRSITLPSGLKTISSSAFKASGLESIVLPSTVTTLNSNAFLDCTSLTKVTISKALQTLGTTSTPANPFAGCTNLVEFRATGDLDNFAVRDGILYDKDLKVIYLYPSAKQDLTTITAENVYNYAFAENKYVREVTLTNVDGALPGYAFYKAKALQKVTLNGKVTKIGQYAFSDATTLTEVVFTGANETTAIDTRAFASTAIESITLPNTIETLGASSFKDATHLASIVLPSALKTISAYAFEGCTDLTSVDMSNLTVDLISVGSSAFSKTGLVEFVIPENLDLSSATSMFLESKSLVKVTINGEITTIPASMFKDCEALTTVLFVNDGVTTGEPGKLILPHSIETLGSGSFINTAIEEVVLNAGLKKLGTQTSTASISYSTKNVDYSVSIPATVDGVFENNTKLKKVTINSTGLETGAVAFRNCTELTDVIFADNVVTLGSNGSDTYYNVAMFVGCTALVNVELGGLELLPSAMFYGCTALENIDLSGVVTVSTGAFMGCTNLQTVTMTDAMGESKLTELFTFAFVNCTSLTEITIPSTVSNWYSAGYTPSATIQIFTFAGCTSLEKVTFDCNMNMLYNGMFWNCTSLRVLKFENTPVDEEEGIVIPIGVALGKDVFNGIGNTKTIRILSSLRDVAMTYYEGNSTDVGCLYWYDSIDCKIIIYGEVFKEAVTI